MAVAHYHFILQAYDVTLDDGRLSGVVSIDIVAISEADALEKAKKLITKPLYRISQIVEHRPDMEG